jgi:hypothetical protein
LFIGRVPTPASIVCHITDLSDISKRLCEAYHLARFLRGEARGSLFVPLQTTNIVILTLSPAGGGSFTTQGEKIMKHAIIALLFIGGFVALSTMEASAVVCARGVYRAGCVGAGGAVVVRRPVARAVVVAPRVAVRRRVY